MPSQAACAPLLSHGPIAPLPTQASYTPLASQDTSAPLPSHSYHVPLPSQASWDPLPNQATHASHISHVPLSNQASRAPLPSQPNCASFPSETTNAPLSSQTLSGHTPLHQSQMPPVQRELLFTPQRTSSVREDGILEISDFDTSFHQTPQNPPRLSPFRFSKGIKSKGRTKKGRGGPPSFNKSSRKKRPR